MQIKCWPVWLVLRWGTYICIGWQVMLHGSEMKSWRHL